MELCRRELVNGSAVDAEAIGVRHGRGIPPTQTADHSDKFEQVNLVPAARGTLYLEVLKIRREAGMNLIHRLVAGNQVDLRALACPGFIANGTARITTPTPLGVDAIRRSGGRPTTFAAGLARGEPFPTPPAG
jgi:hypothetical protein